MTDKVNMTGLEEDAFREIGNVGVGNAATSLSVILHKKIDINLPESEFVRLEKLSYFIGGPEKIVVGLYMNITGDFSGECIFLFDEEGAFKLVDLAIGNPEGTTKKLEPMEMSTFNEIANIFAGSYLNSISNMLNVTITPSIPYTATDMAQAVLDMVILKIASTADEVLCVKTVISIEGHDIDGKFMILFDNESFKKIIEFLRKKYGAL